jgi:hypothetical protein
VPLLQVRLARARGRAHCVLARIACWRASCECFGGQGLALRRPPLRALSDPVFRVLPPPARPPPRRRRAAAANARSVCFPPMRARVFPACAPPSPLALRARLAPRRPEYVDAQQQQQQQQPSLAELMASGGPGSLLARMQARVCVCVWEQRMRCVAVSVCMCAVCLCVCVCVCVCVRVCSWRCVRAVARLW